jgi:hypothetical protein
MVIGSSTDGAGNEERGESCQQEKERGFGLLPVESHVKKLKKGED